MFSTTSKKNSLFFDKVLQKGHIWVNWPIKRRVGNPVRLRREGQYLDDPFDRAHDAVYADFYAESLTQFLTVTLVVLISVYLES